MRVWLRKKRQERGLSELEVSKRAGIAQPFYHNIEFGTKNPSVDTAKKIASVLNFEWTRFFDEKSMDSQMHGDESDAV